MKIKKRVVLSILLGFTALCLALSYPIKPPIAQEVIQNDHYGDIAIAQPMWNVQGLALVFADTEKYSSTDLAKTLAVTGFQTRVIDIHTFLDSLKTLNNPCINVAQIAEAINTILKALPSVTGERLVISGIAEGALIPYLNAQSESVKNAINISVGFSVNLPHELHLCSPLITQVNQQQQNQLLSAPALKTHWRTAWNDKPRGPNGIFIKEYVPDADTNIAAYNTPLETLLTSELRLAIDQGGKHLSIPTIEMPAATKSDVVTLFYSGDGGWRDLDKTVAEEMQKLNASVVGVDVLRYFWERKSPEQVTTDLSTTMAYYRKNWGAQRFVLAGFSFGADILPVLYNKLSEADQQAITMLVFLALGNHADFEVRVAGWLGQSTHEIPLDKELMTIPKTKLLCIYGQEEKIKTGTACTALENSAATVIELPGGHHFDNDYPKLAQKILTSYQQHGIQ